jgi:membrane protein required for colicin V production
MKILDILLILLLTWGGYRGFKSGFVLEILSLISFSVAKIVSIRLLHLFKMLYNKWHGNPGTIPSYIGFAVCFAIILVIIMLLGRFFKTRLHRSEARKIDKGLGLLVGIGKWAFYISTFIWLAALFNIHLPESYIAHTLLYPVIKALSPALIAMVVSWLPFLEKWLEAMKSI